MSDQVTVATEAELDVVVLETDGNYTVITVGEQGPAGAAYQLPAATANTLGGIIVGSNLSITNNGVLSANIPPGGVTAFNNRTGNVTLTANDVTAVANGIYIVDSTIGNIPTFLGPRVLYGQYQTRGQAPAYPYVSGSLGIGSQAIVGVVNSTDPCNIEFSPGDLFNYIRFKSYNKSIVINNDGFSVETGTANWTWSDNSILTQGRADARYLTSANLTWSNITGKPTLATVATSGNYNDLSNKPASYTLPAATNSTLGGIIVGSGLSITNGTLSTTATAGIDGGSATTTGTGSYDGGSATTN